MKGCILSYLICLIMLLKVIFDTFDGAWKLILVVVM